MSDELPAIQRPPVRSALFIPANRGEWIDKAPKYGADALILDLEDATPSAEKPGAREIVAERLPRLEAQGQVAWVRINEPGSTDLEADIAAICRTGLGAVCVPKVRDTNDVALVDRLLTYHEGVNDLPLGSVAIDPLLETAAGIASAGEIFAASGRIAYAGGLAAEGADVQRALGYRWTDDFRESFALRSQSLIAARAAGVHNPVTGLVASLDTDQVERYAEESRTLGYEGLLVIHPTHIEIANRVFSPSEAEVEHAREVIRRMNAAELGGRGAAVDENGAMIDAAHAETSKLIIARHELFKRRD
jgi:citrate lyase subunit beta/citryl-CoA lyase